MIVAKLKIVIPTAEPAPFAGSEWRDHGINPDPFARLRLYLEQKTDYGKLFTSSAPTP